MAKIERYCAVDVWDPPGYSQAIKVTEAQTLLFLSGQVAREPDGSVGSRGDFMGQAREVYRAVKALVEKGGGTMESVVRFSVYLTDMRYWRDLQVVHSEVFTNKMPAYTLLEVGSLAHPDWLIEVQATAVF
jgi:2-iminobutanoate/2-iminopropanoate deaminase